MQKILCEQCTLLILRNSSLLRQEIHKKSPFDGRNKVSLGCWVMLCVCILYDIIRTAILLIPTEWESAKPQLVSKFFGILTSTSGIISPRRILCGKIKTDVKLKMYLLAAVPRSSVNSRIYIQCNTNCCMKNGQQTSEEGILLKHRQNTAARNPLRIKDIWPYSFYQEWNVKTEDTSKHTLNYGKN